MPKASPKPAPDFSGLIQLVSCEVALGENHETVVKRGPRNPLTYPEVLVLERLHYRPGRSEAVRKVEHLGYIKRSVRQEKRRLSAKYKRAVVEEVYPGQSPAMETLVPVDGMTPPPGEKCVIGDFVNAEPPRPAPIKPDPAPDPALEPVTE